MPDREKVISGLEYCSSGGCYDPCCPYNDPEEDNCVGCTSKLAADALALLKKQEAVKPQLSISGMWYECPICHRHLTKDRDNYCARCGRAVKWDDGD